jgi:hypothetical protein
MNHDDFILRILYQPTPAPFFDDYAEGKITFEQYNKHTDEWWKNPDSPPPRDILQQAVGQASGLVQTETNRADFEKLAEVLDHCVEEEMPVRGFGQAGKNATKHPAVVALTKLEPLQRSRIAIAAAQWLLWTDDCAKWVHRANLRTQISIRVLTSVIVVIAKKKTTFSPDDLATLTRIGASMQSRDVFVLRAMAAIVEILTKHVDELPRDTSTLQACRELLNTPDIFASKDAMKAKEKLQLLLRTVS